MHYSGLFRTLIVVAAALLFSADMSLAQKKQPTDTDVIDMIGSRLVKVFQKFGSPTDVTFSRSDNPDFDGVVLDYDSFGFKIRAKTVRVCYFWADWKGAVHGIKIGDNRAKAVQVLGSDYRTEKNSAGVDDYGWILADNDAYLWVIFDKDDKVIRIQTELK